MDVEFLFLSEKNRDRYMRIVRPVGNILARFGFHPNVLSIAGLLLSGLAGIFFGIGSFFWAAWIVVIAGICDTLDGQLARQTGKSSAFGAFFDSTLDRYSDILLFMGLAFYFAGGNVYRPAKAPTSPEADPWGVLIILLAVTGSFLVSYTRARAEGLGTECRIGLMQRPERVTLIVIGSLLGSIPTIGPLLLKLTLLILAVSSNVTALHRIVYVRKQMLKVKGGMGKDRLRCPHSGEPVERHRNPLPTVDIIIGVGDGIVLIKRKNPPFGWAIPGGFVDYGESLEEAAVREAKEETSLDVELIDHLGAFSAPDRDPRQHSISNVFIARADGRPIASDDAAELGIFTENTLPEPLAFDHADILRHFFDKTRRGSTP